MSRLAQNAPLNHLSPSTKTHTLCCLSRSLHTICNQSQSWLQMHHHLYLCWTHPSLTPICWDDTHTIHFYLLPNSPKNQVPLCPLKPPNTLLVSVGVGLIALCIAKTDSRGLYPRIMLTSSEDLLSLVCVVISRISQRCEDTPPPHYPIIPSIFGGKCSVV